MEKMNGSNIADPGKKSIFLSERWFWTFFLLTAATGGFLRLYLITDQVLLGDEWHALNFSINHSVWYLFTHFSYAGANIIPVNAYVRLLLVSCGWSEILLFLPSLIAGIASLLVFPLVLKRFFGARITIFFAFLFAVSPVVIFYSRVCRPYSIFTFLGFLSIWLLYEWSLSGKIKFGFLFAVNGVLCVYFHFVGVIFVFVPLCCVIIIKLVPKFPRLPVLREKVLPNFFELIRLGCSILICLAILLSAAIIQRQPVTGMAPAHFTLHSILGFMQIFSGTSYLFLNILFYVLLSIGLVRIFRKSFLLGFMFTSVFAAYVFVMLVTKTNFGHSPIVLARYIIPAFPMGYALVAIGLDSLWQPTAALRINKRIANILCYSFAGCFLFALVWAGPLRYIYKAPNNFTSHSVFLKFYAPFDWKNHRNSVNFPTGSTVNENTTFAFYKSLANQPNIKKIIEYPMLLGNECNLLYYYQRFHGKEVAVGYTRAIKGPQNEVSAIIYTDMMMDFVLSQVRDSGQLKFQNMVDIQDMTAVNNSRAELVIFHKNPILEIFEPETLKNGGKIPGLSLISAVSKAYRKFFGQPIFEDRRIVVFKVS